MSNNLSYKLKFNSNFFDLSKNRLIEVQVIEVPLYFNIIITYLIDILCIYIDFLILFLAHLVTVLLIIYL